MAAVEIVMNELRKLRMSADFFANTFLDICRCPVYLEIDIYTQKKCKKCLEAENIPLTDLLFYILKNLDPYALSM